MKNFALALLAVLLTGNFASADTLTLSDFAPNGAYSIQAGFNGGIGGLGLTANPTTVNDASFDGSTVNVGSTFGTTPQSIFASEAFTDNGGGDFTLEISVTSNGNLAPALFLNGNTAANAILFIGQNISGTNVAVLPHVVTSVSLESFDQNGGITGASNPINTGAFNDPANNFAAWEGFIGGVVAGGAQGTSLASGAEDRVAELRLTINGTIEKVPEPTSAVLLCGLGLAGLLKRRR